MQGIFIEGRRPKSKKAVREAIAADSRTVRIEATSWFGNEYSGPASNLPSNYTVHFVGPDPHTKRSFYGTLKWKNGKLSVS